LTGAAMAIDVVTDETTSAASAAIVVKVFIVTPCNSSVPVEHFPYA
jgi:hypothetical protein